VPSNSWFAIGPVVVGEDVHNAPLAALALVPLLGLLAVFARERHRRVQSMLELSSAYRGTALVLGDVIEADDGYTGEHCKSVVTLALELAAHLGLSPERQRNLAFAAPRDGPPRDDVLPEGPISPRHRQPHYLCRSRSIPEAPICGVILLP
jgi:hypothetical protein